MITIHPEDVLRSKTIEPGLYTLEVKSYKEDKDSKSGAALYVFDFVVVDAGPYQGVPISTQFSEKAMGFMIPFIQAIGGQVSDKEARTFDPNKFVGKKVKGNIVNDTYQGRTLNKINGYAPA